MRAKQITTIHSSLDARHVPVNGLVLNKDYSLDEYMELSKLGIYGLDKIHNEGFGYESAGMDTIQAGLTTASVGTPIQFLQGWLPGNVKIITAARKIDEIIGITTIGDFYDSQMVQGLLENTGFSTVYSDYSNVPLSNYNINYVYRDAVRFEDGFRVGILEEGVAAKGRVNAASEKREAAMNNLEITRNQIGFYGYNSGLNLTYGLLNDPNLPGYNTVATGAVSGSKLWSLKTWAEIVSDLLTAIQGIRTQSKDTIDSDTTPMTLTLATDIRDYMAKTNEFGISVMGWLNATYPKIRVNSAPQFNGANGGANIFYLFADKVMDTSTDGGATFIQMVPTKFMVTGVQKLIKGYEEAFANSTAGIMCKRPYAVYRVTGV